MRSIFSIVGVMLLLSIILSPPICAQPTAVYVVTYIEVVPKAVDAATTLLKNYRNANLGLFSCQRFDVLHEISRPERFATFEIWSSVDALDNRDKTASATSFQKMLAKIRGAPNDVRRNSGLYVGSFPKDLGSNAIYVITHVDLIPQSNDKWLALLKAMRDSASREPNNLGYDVLQQSNRPNHFTVVEAWKNTPTLDIYVEAQQTRDFRQSLSPMEGAPYDDRRYEILQ